jgi:hypothetical protein
MSGIPRTRRWLSVAAQLAGPPPPDPAENWAADRISTDVGSVVGGPSFRRIVPIPFPAWVAALDSWQLTGPGGALRLGTSVLRGPAEHDRHLGTCRIEARLARGLLRPPVRMRLGIDYWSATSTALELIPCQRVRPGAAYFRAGRALLDSLTDALPAHAPARPRPGRGTAHRPAVHQGQPKAGVAGGPAAGAAEPAA